MSNTTGSIKALGASRREALQGLLGSLGQVSGSPSSNTKLSAEQVRKLSERISEILEEDSYRGSAREDQLYELTSEDGLPIVDITEPINEGSRMGTPSTYISEPELVPLSLLPTDEKERRRRERDRILDLLEKEERLQQLQEERDVEEERREAIKKRKESAKAELAHLKAAQELQKKMGRALVRNPKGTEDGRGDEDAHSKPQFASSSATKSESFVDVPATEDDGKGRPVSIRQPGWGEVTPGRLRAQNRIPLVSTAEAQKYPMKTHVVERHPTIAPTSPLQPNADSDDEPSSTMNFSPHARSDLSNEEAPSSDSDLVDNEPLEEGLDYDAARHHHEIAVEYHQKRHAIGAEAAKALAAYDLDDDEQHESIQPARESPLSHLRADRMTAAYDKSYAPVSTSPGQTVIPASRQKFLRNSLRQGRLEDDRLVGGESEDSESGDEATRELIQLLRTGNIENVGPGLQPPSMPTVSPLQKPIAVDPTVAETSSVTRGAKQSRFKLTRGDGKRIQDGRNEDNVRSQQAISSVIERKAPRASPDQRFPTNKPPPRPSIKASEPSPPMVVQSPSFPIASTVAIASSSPIAGGTPSLNRTQAGFSPSGEPSAIQNSIIPPQDFLHDSARKPAWPGEKSNEV